ncbi:uncharacterized protein LOC126836079 isoform X2 [Adelges cooleyi]|uniref:uncharacterized protein LOC126836079 isoform X2 n=1 Tax=Adelges cooleyi TaxID=133065 RepID=UPI00217FEBDD|nr:uncharacterized protein LOC126836079 isoform X2 [Adelges cooleyi]
MKLVCVLISFAFVNVSAVTLTDYKMELYITNNYFNVVQQKKNLMCSLVKNYLCSTESTNYVHGFVEGLILSATSFEDLVIALAAPESVNYEKRIQNLLRWNHGIELGFPNTSGKNFDSIELSDLAKTRRNIVKLSLKRLHKKVIGQNDGENFNECQKCYIIALMISLNKPRNRITKAYIDNKGYCNLTDSYGGNSLFEV